MSLAMIARHQGDSQGAINLLQEGLTLFQKIGDITNLGFCLLEFSIVAAIQGHSQLAVQLYAAADMLLERLGYSSDHPYRADSEHHMTTVRLRMGDARFRAAWESGRTLILDQVIKQAHGLGSALEQSDSQIQRERGTKDETLLVPLNEREIEVLHLIAEGLSNNEIAERLVIALSTVKWHINNLFGKLGVHSRTQAVAQAKELGLL
jgi:DNA-binding CsgD family transcriptional regulator